MPLRAGVLIVTVSAAAILSTIPRFQWLSLAVVIGASALLGWLWIRAARAAARQQRSADDLRRLNETLEAQADVRTAELQDSNARLRSIIESAVDGIIVIDAQGRVESFNPAPSACSATRSPKCSAATSAC